MKTDALISRLLPIVHEDQDLLVLIKPAGVDVGGLDDQTAPGLIEILKTVALVKSELYVTHRLSRFESGILVLAKSREHASRLKTSLKSGQWQQEYTIVVLGQMSKPRLVVGGQPEAPPPKSRLHPKGKRFFKRPLPASSSAATLGVMYMQRLAGTEKRSLVLCKTRAPTTHALRAQLRSVRLRVLGDRLHDPSIRPKPPSDTCVHLSRLTIDHPGTGRKLALTSRAPESFEHMLEGDREFERVLQAGLVRRLPLLLDDQTDSFRLLTGYPESLPGLAAEKLNGLVILQVVENSPRLSEQLTPIAKWYRQMLSANAVYLKSFVKARDRTDAEILEQMRSSWPMIGEPAPPELTVRENGLRFLTKPYDGFSVGLFFDQRDNRQRVRSIARDKDMLNLFAYTCGFSIAAAIGGASSTVSVDLSPKALEWGRENFALNDLDPARHEFYAADAIDFLKRTYKKERSFDIIILDPPSFAHGRKAGKSFSIMEDLPELVRCAVDVLRPGGTLMVSTNHRKMSMRKLREAVSAGAGRRTHRVETPSLPIDFAMDPDHAKTLFVEFDKAVAMTSPPTRRGPTTITGREMPPRRRRRIIH